MTTPYAVGTKFLNKSFEDTGLPRDYVLTVEHVTEVTEGEFEYLGSAGYGVDHSWVEAGFVEVV